MVATGVSVSDESIHEFNKIINRHNSSVTFVIYKIEDERCIVTEHLGESDDIEEFLDLLPENDCRYALYKTRFTTKDGRESSKLVKITWTPSSASVRTKMISAASSAALGAVLGGAVTTKLNIKCREDMTVEALQEACRRF
mmetsp:Transcript_8786/g.14967  ORF Transcript_8786/g.14967 Transcript_8786/m.14967 type:complete len:141 (-) Transcript_8786:189-611(-)|eukprot:CAMPEP_0114422848 /NCGR_PEP_ID=MMETSP0103-20121206/5830_1 /TAXON_ID=37642 ORGANISM="Paraphysomonas imperforata, Strain PA2" /NCGR_SAMPLE_ID=MMETSP0103 /ASSEMBLY_ACC=CAM_ASM_000201 /LENGTH=140 /DNA_ID=CAMNT_0001591463 /DNA_START=60 /DNA_END=482 /DNA_ORIENTATION=+